MFLCLLKRARKHTGGSGASGENDNRVKQALKKRQSQDDFFGCWHNCTQMGRGCFIHQYRLYYKIFNNPTLHCTRYNKVYSFLAMYKKSVICISK